MDTGDSNRVWCVTAVLASDPRLSGGATMTESQGQGEEVGEGVDGRGQHLTSGRAPCLGVQNPDSPRRLSEGRQCRMWTPLDPHVVPCLFPLTSVALEGETGAADV